MLHALALSDSIAGRRDATLRKAQLQARLVVLDLRELEFLDSSGLHAILDASSRARQVGRRLVVLHGPPNVDRIFTLTRISDEVEIAAVDPVEPPPVERLPEADRAP